MVVAVVVGAEVEMDTAGRAEGVAGGSGGDGAGAGAIEGVTITYV